MPRTEPATVHIDAHRREALEAEIAELAAHTHAATCRLLVLVREFDLAEGWVEHGCRSMAHWLHWRCGFSLRTAREKVRVAHALTSLPLVEAAFARGKLSYAKVRAVTRIATRDNEAMLLDWARHADAGKLERIVRSYRRYGETSAAQTQQARRDFVHYTDNDGSVVIRVRLPAEAGAVVLKGIEAALADLQEAGAGSAEPPAPKERPDGACQPDENGLRPQSGPAEPFCEETTPGQRRSDAILHLARSFLRGARQSRGFGEHFQVHVHLDARENIHGPCCPGDAPALSEATIRRLGCESALVGVVHGPKGQILSVGRKTRAVPPPIRRALRLRDGGCRFPGCTNHRHVDAHHVVHWADGGETKLSNLVLLCRHHHRLVHEGGFGVRITHDGLFVFTRPDGSRLPDLPSLPLPPRDSLQALRRLHSHHRITPRTPASLHAGGGWELALCIAALDTAARRATAGRPRASGPGA